jgi:hypothetical protein
MDCIPNNKAVGTLQSVFYSKSLLMEFFLMLSSVLPAGFFHQQWFALLPVAANRFLYGLFTLALVLLPFYLFLQNYRGTVQTSTNCTKNQNNSKLNNETSNNHILISFHRVLIATCLSKKQGTTLHPCPNPQCSYHYDWPCYTLHCKQNITEKQPNTVIWGVFSVIRGQNSIR